MDLMADNILTTAKSLPVKSICGETCVSIMDIAHTLHIKKNDIPLFIQELNSLEAAGKVTLIHGPYGLPAGVIVN